MGNLIQRYVILFLLSAVIVLQFQNCDHAAPPVSQANNFSSPPLASPDATDKLPSSPAEEMKLEDLKKMDFGIDGGTGKWLNRIDLDTAQIQTSETGAPTGLCLTEDEKNELGRIITNSQICLPDNSQVQEVCTHVFVQAYTRLVAANGQNTRIGRSDFRLQSRR